MYFQLSMVISYQGMIYEIGFYEACNSQKKMGSLYVPNKFKNVILNSMLLLNMNFAA